MCSLYQIFSLLWFLCLFHEFVNPQLLSDVCIFIFLFCKGSIKKLSFFQISFCTDLVLYFYRLSFIWFFCFYYLIMLSHYLTFSPLWFLYDFSNLWTAPLLFIVLFLDFHVFKLIPQYIKHPGKIFSFFRPHGKARVYGYMKLVRFLC